VTVNKTNRINPYCFVFGIIIALIIYKKYGDEMRTKQISIIFLSLMILAIGSLALNHYFLHTSYNTLQENIIGEMKIFASQIMNYYNTPRRIHGGGFIVQDDDLLFITDFVKFDNVNFSINHKTSTFTSKIALYHLTIQEKSVKIIGLSNNGEIKVTMLITPSSSEPVVINLEK
jgi:hypothetical protein